MILKAITAAFQFLTIIPIRTKSVISERDVYNSASFFPLVGVLQGFLLAFPAYLLLKIMSADITAVVVLSFYLLITGGFHQDGLSDTFDALSVKSSGNRERDREKRLQIMKDSTVGPMGVIVIVLSLLLKYLLMKEVLITSNRIDGYSLFFLMPVFSKWVMVTAMYHSKSARTDGIGKTFLGHIMLRQVACATALLLTSFVTWCAFYSFFCNAFQWGAMNCTLFFLSETVLICFTCLIMKYIFTARFGGLTGDNFGAIHEISEILFLTVALLWR